MRKIRLIAILLVCTAILYFIVGYIVVELKLIENFTNQEYQKSAAIVGALASILGLLAMVIPSITTADLKKLESDSLRQVADLADEMKMADKKIEQRNEKLLSLEDRNKNLELQIRKASMILFLKKKLEKNYIDLTEIYYESLENKKKLNALNEEVSDLIDSDTLKEIMDLIEERDKKDFLGTVDSVFWLKPNFMGIGIDMNALNKFVLRKTQK